MDPTRQNVIRSRGEKKKAEKDTDGWFSPYTTSLALLYIDTLVYNSLKYTSS